MVVWSWQIILHLTNFSLGIKLDDNKSLDTLLSSVSLGTHVVNNVDGNSPLTSSLTFSKAFTNSNSYTYSVTCEQSVETNFKFGTNEIFAKQVIDVKIGLRFSETNSWTHSTSKTSTLSLSESITVASGKCSEVTGYYKITKGNQVPLKQLS